MKRRTALIILFVIAAACLTLLAACSAGADYSMYSKVTFVFNYSGTADGGTYKNSVNPVSYYYPVQEGEEMLVYEPEALSQGLDEFVRDRYTIEGWYRTKNGDEYSDKWDFSSDTVGYLENVTLYAHWKRDLNFSYVVCYIDEDGNECELGRYENKDEGEKFNDTLNYAARRIGYTKLRFYDENGNTWDPQFGHPGGETDTEVKVYVEYIKGNFKLVGTASEFLSATNGFSSSNNIYLTDDIDLGGASVTCLADGYSGIFRGNGRTVSNFSLYYATDKKSLISDDDLGDGLLVISMFGRLNGATVENVTFDGVKIDVNVGVQQAKQIIIAPFALRSVKSQVSGVTFNGSYTVSRLPNDFPEGNISISADLCYLRDDDTSITQSFFNFARFDETAGQAGIVRQEVAPLSAEENSKRKKSN